MFEGRARAPERATRVHARLLPGVAGVTRTDSGPPRWQDPALDEAALEVARLMRGAVSTLRAGGHERWAAYLEPLVPVLEDGDRGELLRAARRARAAYGARDSVLEAWPSPDAFRLRDGIDELQALLERRRAVEA